MTQKAGPDSIVGDFSAQVLTNAAYVNAGEIRRNGDEFLFRYLKEQGRERQGDDWKRISLTTGSHHMQAYWFPTGRGNTMDMMPFMYIRESGQWVPREAAFLMPPDEMFHPELGRWNEICMDCHTTGGQKRASLETRTHDSRAGELGISCEACHGPGENHAALRRAHTEEDFNRDKLKDPIVNPQQLLHARSSEVCGRCHSFRGDKRMDQNARNYHPGDVLADTQLVIRGTGKSDLEEFASLSPRHRSQAEGFYQDLPSTFWGDGAVRVAGREFNGLIDSACHKAGEMTCLSCHQMHQSGKDGRTSKQWADDQLGVGMRGNKGCTQCHEADQYETSDHTHHAAGSVGSNCYDCHMTHTSYALLKAVRSHTIASPNVAETVKYGRQNACNNCHLDQTLAWTSKHLHEWYGHDPVELNEDQRKYSSIVISAAKGNAVERALAAWHLGWKPALEASRDTTWIPSILSGLMDDEYAAVRFIAARSLRAQAGFEDVAFDFVADASERARVVGDVRRRWMGRPEAKRTPNVAVLIGDGGGFDDAAIVHLLKQRDRRRVKINE